MVKVRVDPLKKPKYPYSSPKELLPDRDSLEDHNLDEPITETPEPASGFWNAVNSSLKSVVSLFTFQEPESSNNQAPNNTQRRLSPNDNTHFVSPPPRSSRNIPLTSKFEEDDEEREEEEEEEDVPRYSSIDAIKKMRNNRPFRNNNAPINDTKYIYQAKEYDFGKAFTTPERREIFERRKIREQARYRQQYISNQYNSEIRKRETNIFGKRGRKNEEERDARDTEVSRRKRRRKTQETAEREGRVKNLRSLGKQHHIVLQATEKKKRKKTNYEEVVAPPPSRKQTRSKQYSSVALQILKCIDAGEESYLKLPEVDLQPLPFKVKPAPKKKRKKRTTILSELLEEEEEEEKGKAFPVPKNKIRKEIKSSRYVKQKHVFASSIPDSDDHLKPFLLLYDDGKPAKRPILRKKRKKVAGKKQVSKKRMGRGRRRGEVEEEEEMEGEDDLTVRVLPQGQGREVRTEIGKDDDLTSLRVEVGSLADESDSFTYRSDDTQRSYEKKSEGEEEEEEEEDVTIPPPPSTEEEEEEEVVVKVPSESKKAEEEPEMSKEGFMGFPSFGATPSSADFQSIPDYNFGEGFDTNSQKDIIIEGKKEEQMDKSPDKVVLPVEKKEEVSVSEEKKDTEGTGGADGFVFGSGFTGSGSGFDSFGDGMQFGGDQKEVEKKNEKKNEEESFAWVPSGEEKKKKSENEEDSSGGAFFTSFSSDPTFGSFLNDISEPAAKEEEKKKKKADDWMVGEKTEKKKKETNDWMSGEKKEEKKKDDEAEAKQTEDGGFAGFEGFTGFGSFEAPETKSSKMNFIFGGGDDVKKTEPKKEEKEEKPKTAESTELPKEETKSSEPEKQKEEKKARSSTPTLPTSSGDGFASFIDPSIGKPSENNSFLTPHQSTTSLPATSEEKSKKEEKEEEKPVQVKPTVAPKEKEEEKPKPKSENIFASEEQAPTPRQSVSASQAQPKQESSSKIEKFFADDSMKTEQQPKQEQEPAASETKGDYMNDMLSLFGGDSKPQPMEKDNQEEEVKPEDTPKEDSKMDIEMSGIPDNVFSFGDSNPIVPSTNPSTNNTTNNTLNPSSGSGNGFGGFSGGGTNGWNTGGSTDQFGAGFGGGGFGGGGNDQSKSDDSGFGDVSFGSGTQTTNFAGSLNFDNLDSNKSNVQSDPLRNNGGLELDFDFNLGSAPKRPGGGMQGGGGFRSSRKARSSFT